MWSRSWIISTLQWNSLKSWQCSFCSIHVTAVDLSVLAKSGYLRSSRPNAWLVTVQELPGSGGSVEPPELSKASEPHACEWIQLRILRACARQTGPIKQEAHLASAVSQPLTARVVNNPGPSWDFCPGLLRLARSPPRRRTILSFNWLSFHVRWARRPTPDYRRLYYAYRRLQTQA